MIERLTKATEYVRYEVLKPNIYNFFKLYSYN